MQPTTNYFIRVRNGVYSYIYRDPDILVQYIIRPDQPIEVFVS